MAEAEPRPDYEPSDAPPRLVAALTGGLAAALIAIPLVLAALYPWALQISVPAPAVQPPPPRLQVAPRADLAALRHAEDARLTGYGIDASGAVHIPIGRAMQLIAARGLPGWPKQ